MPPAKLSITLSVYKTISIAESDLFLQKMTKKSDLLAANHFFQTVDKAPSCEGAFLVS